MYQTTYTTFFGIRVFSKRWSEISTHIQALEYTFEDEADLKDYEESIQKILDLLREIEPLMKEVNHLSGKIGDVISDSIREGNKLELREGEKTTLNEVLQQGAGEFVRKRKEIPKEKQMNKLKALAQKVQDLKEELGYE